MQLELARIYRENVLRDILLETIRVSSPVTREQLLGAILGFFDAAIDDLLNCELITCQTDPGNESHMDMFAMPTSCIAE